MIVTLANLFNDKKENIRGKVVALYVLLFVFNAAAWLWAIVAFHNYPVLLGTAALAYSFGLRHAFDADHIAAIDNVTRKLMQEGRRPVGVGLFFSLGHSTIVVALTVAIAVATTTLQGRFGAFRSFGGVVGTLVSALFLFAIAIANIIVLVSVWRTFQTVKTGRPVRRGRARPHARQSRPARAPVPPLLSPDRAQLADVSARRPVRPRLRHRDRGRPARRLGHASAHRAFRSGRSWSFRRCSPPA